MPCDLAVRLHYQDVLTLGWLYEWILSVSESLFVVCHHVGSPRQHIHLAIKGVKWNADTFRRKIKAEYNSRHEDAVDASDLSSKKWDGGDKYLIYMIKGQPTSIHPILHNHTKTELWLSDERIEILRKAWKEGVCPQAENYKMWMAHETFPKKPVISWEQIGESNAPKLAFEDIVKSAQKFICSIHGEWITAKHRFAIKDIVSNYCIRNGIKMSSIYI